MILITPSEVLRTSAVVYCARRRVMSRHYPAGYENNEQNPATGDYQEKLGHSPVGRTDPEDFLRVSGNEHGWSSSTSSESRRLRPREQVRGIILRTCSSRSCTRPVLLRGGPEGGRYRRLPGVLGLLRLGGLIRREWDDLTASVGWRRNSRFPHESTGAASLGRQKGGWPGAGRSYFAGQTLDWQAVVM
jgi:hypothetical protein